MFEMLRATAAADFDDDDDSADASPGARAVASAIASASGASGASGARGARGARGAAPDPVPAATLAAAFKSLRLVCDDFLAFVPRAALVACVGAIGAFAAQRVDVNSALTATGTPRTRVADGLGG